MLYCTTCHAYLPQGTNVCPSCGRHFARAVTGPTQRLQPADALLCLRCNGPMEPGFTLEIDGRNKRRRVRWVAGIPKRSIWFGDISTSGQRMLFIRTYRCVQCGYLESYARDDDISEP